MSSLAASAAGKALTGAGLRIVGAQQGGTTCTEWHRHEKGGYIAATFSL